MTYSPALYDASTQCDECGSSLIGVRLFRGFFKHGKFCLSACKWLSAYREACSVPGVRPLSPAGAWAWTCHEAWVRSGPYCEKCEKLLGRHYGSDRETWYPAGRVDYHHIIPISQGGNSLPENLRVLCEDCHKGEHTAAANQRRKHIPLETFIDIPGPESTIV